MLTSASLQLIAIVTMFIDHFGAYVLHDGLITRAIGRLAMPLFCFMLSEGFLHTKGKQRLRYFGRLIIFAFISQFAFDLAHFAGAGASITMLPFELSGGLLDYSLYLNVMFTLALGFLAMALIEYGGWAMICMPILLIFSEVLHVDYGVFGILYILGFYLSTKWFPKEGQKIERWIGYIITLFSVTAAHVSINGNPRQLFAMLAIVPIILYNGKLGKRLPKWFGYIFYPAHLLLIAAIAFTITAIRS